MRIVINISEHDKEWIGNAYGIPQDINTKIAEAIINAEPCQPESHWIPVTERLPERAENDLEYSTVLVCFDNGEVDTACFYESTREWGCGDMYNCICHPIAWMPLPEPFKGVTE